MIDRQLRFLEDFTNISEETTNFSEYSQRQSEEFANIIDNYPKNPWFFIFKVDWPATADAPKKLQRFSKIDPAKFMRRVCMISGWRYFKHSPKILERFYLDWLTEHCPKLAEFTRKLRRTQEDCYKNCLRSRYWNTSKTSLLSDRKWVKAEFTFSVCS